VAELIQVGRPSCHPTNCIKALKYDSVPNWGQHSILPSCCPNRSGSKDLESYVDDVLGHTSDWQKHMEMLMRDFSKGFGKHSCMLVAWLHGLPCPPASREQPSCDNNSVPDFQTAYCHRGEPGTLLW